MSQIGPIDTSVALTAAIMADKATKQSELPGLHNGPADAFRHCVWSCAMAGSIGVTQAKIIGDNHEIEGDKNGQPPDEKEMDLYNNQKGRDCDLERESKTCPQKCLNLINKRELKWMEESNW
ncbi:DUF6973 domain-containing protein [Chitiniphilus shinanonensis]|uniref:DUF6973 domain-containing protein n=1 Tax=Chitiniphilus shinanonensis TaxID=553088 RepID=UPI003341EB8F